MHKKYKKQNKTVSALETVQGFSAVGYGEGPGAVPPTAQTLHHH